MTAVSSDVYYTLYFSAIATLATIELATLQHLHAVAPYLLPAALVLQQVPSVVATDDIWRMFTFSRSGFAAQTSRGAFLSGLLRFGAFMLTFLAMSSTEGAMSQPVFTIQMHFFIHALRLLLSRKRSLVRWTAVVLITAGILCIITVRRDRDFIAAPPIMSESALMLYVLYWQIKMCVVPVGCLLAAQLCEILIGEQDVEVQTLRYDTWHATGTLALLGFAVFAAVKAVVGLSAITPSSTTHTAVFCLSLIPLISSWRRSTFVRLIRHIEAPSSFELSMITDAARAVATMTITITMPTGVGGYSANYLVIGFSTFFMLGGAIATEADTWIEARRLAQTPVDTARSTKKRL